MVVNAMQNSGNRWMREREITIKTRNRQNTYLSHRVRIEKQGHRRLDDAEEDLGVDLATGLDREGVEIDAPHREHGRNAKHDVERRAPATEEGIRVLQGPLGVQKSTQYVMPA